MALYGLRFWELPFSRIFLQDVPIGAISSSLIAPPLRKSTFLNIVLTSVRKPTNVFFSNACFLVLTKEQLLRRTLWLFLRPTFDKRRLSKAQLVSFFSFPYKISATSSSLLINDHSSDGRATAWGNRWKRDELLAPPTDYLL